MYRGTKEFEGLSLQVYKDTLGNLTVGYGHKVLPSDDLASGDWINQDEADQLYAQDMETAMRGARALVANYLDMPQAVRDILNDLTFNLGYIGFSHFHNTLDAFRCKEWGRAADGLENSLWCSQVGNRCTNTVETLRELVNA